MYTYVIICLYMSVYVCAIIYIILLIITILIYVCIYNYVYIYIYIYIYIMEGLDAAAAVHVPLRVRLRRGRLVGEKEHLHSLLRLAS